MNNENNGMRDIKFRAKRIDNEEWVYGDISNNPLTGKSHMFSYNNEKSFVYEVIPKTASQFIGLSDKNGQEIYERDKISFTKTHNNKHYIGVVQYCEEVAGFMLSTMDNGHWYSFEFGLGTVDLEVVT